MGMAQEGERNDYSKNSLHLADTCVDFGLNSSPNMEEGAGIRTELNHMATEPFNGHLQVMAVPAGNPGTNF